MFHSTTPYFQQRTLLISSWCIMYPNICIEGLVTQEWNVGWNIREQIMKSNKQGKIYLRMEKEEINYGNSAPINSHAQNESYLYINSICRYTSRRNSDKLIIVATFVAQSQDLWPLGVINKPAPSLEPAKFRRDIVCNLSARFSPNDVLMNERGDEWKNAD